MPSAAARRPRRAAKSRRGKRAPTTRSAPPQGTAAAADNTLVIEGKRVPVSNLGKILYPATGFTKGDIVQYYIAIAPFLLPHLKGRPLTLKRYPDGVNAFFFYEKQCPPHRPEWVRTTPVYSEGRGAMMQYCLANDLPTLVWAANLACLELHTSLARSTALNRPTTMVFDLDPGDGADVVACARVALRLRDKLKAARLDSCIKFSGSKGLQLYVPLNTAVTFEQTKTESLRLAEAIATELPQLVVTNMKKSLRRGKVLIDWSQNDRHKTTVCVYSLRAKEAPYVSMPLKWSEVSQLVRGADPESVRFLPEPAVARVRKLGDLFAPVLALKQRLPK